MGRTTCAIPAATMANLRRHRNQQLAARLTWCVSGHVSTVGSDPASVGLYLHPTWQEYSRLQTWPSHEMVPESTDIGLESLGRTREVHHAPQDHSQGSGIRTEQVVDEHWVSGAGRGDASFARLDTDGWSCKQKAYFNCY